jgi:hypothetical protein
MSRPVDTNGGREVVGWSGDGRRETAEGIQTLDLGLKTQDPRPSNPDDRLQLARGQPRVEPQSAPFERPAIPQKTLPRPASRAQEEAGRGPITYY